MTTALHVAKAHAYGNDFLFVESGAASTAGGKEPALARQLAGSVGVFAVALAGGAALAAVAILPFLELLFHSADLTQRSGAKEVGLDTHYFAALALPDYWGRPGQHTLVLTTDRCQLTLELDAAGARITSLET